MPPTKVRTDLYDREVGPPKQPPQRQRNVPLFPEARRLIRSRVKAMTWDSTTRNQFRWIDFALLKGLLLLSR